ncbi:MAG: hypothetical protein ISS25_00305 [Nanoarchaeota archaeon]|nr:hypothetical protein [DPANN group archaeon]MBL7116258.1 hypothetical protein [Nanoarchaeota archaeon]
MKKILLLLVILLFPFSSAEDLFDYQSLELEHKISSYMIINPTSSNYYVTSAEILLSWFPRDDYRQEISYIQTEPSGEEENDGLNFVFRKPQKKKLDVSVESVVETSSDYKKVFSKVKFPITELDSEFAPFLTEQDIIDINNEISDLASELAAEKDDLFEVVFSFADWVERNIEYNLSTLTAEAAQKSSWVITNRYGVCDELTSLFISLNRAVGIPARFISGMSYTNLEIFESPWGPHGWAEVYFPDVGWVPFDVTYRQFGWVDATHIKLKESDDSSTSSVNYNAKGKNFNIQSGEIENEVDVISRGNLKQPLVSIDLEIQKEKAGFGSYNLVTAEVTNNQPYYITVSLQLAATQNVENFDDRFRNILLKPKEKKKEYFIVRVLENLKSGYIYTFPLKAVSSSTSAETSFKSEKKATVFDYNYFKSQIPEEKTVYSPINIECEADKSAVYIGEPLTINCKFTNKENKALGIIDICLEDECHKKQFGPKEQYNKEFVKEMPSVGVKNLAVTAKNDDFSITKYILIHSVDTPLVKISKLDYSEEVLFEEQADISFSVLQESFSNPSDIKVTLEGKRLSQSWNVEDLDIRREFSIAVPAKIMSLGLNEFKISVSYKDEKGQDYLVEEEFSIELINVSFSERIIIFLNQLSLIIDNFFPKLS